MPALPVDILGVEIRRSSTLRQLGRQTCRVKQQEITCCKRFQVCFAKNIQVLKFLKTEQK